MKKIKVIHIYKDFNVYNGLIEILTIIARNIDHDKFDLGVCVFRYDGNSFGEAFEKLGGKIFSLNIPNKLYNEPRELIALYRFLKKTKPDIVQTHVLKGNFYGVIAARLARIPIIIGTEMTLKDTAPSRVRRVRDKVIQPLLSLVLQNCSKFIVTSRFIKEEWYKLTLSKKFEIIYPPFNLEKYIEAMIGSKTFETHNYPKIGFVGRLSEEKGIHLLINSMSEIIKQVPNIKLVIVGTGPLKDELNKLTRHLQLNSHVDFMGFQQNPLEIMRQLDVFVLPSRTEGCPIVVLEAMAMGLPVVATNVGGTPELVKDGETGILVPYNAPNRMAQAIIDLIQNKEQAAAMGRKGREIAIREFHPTVFVNRLQDLYSRLSN
jgi:glycosyltransferase involved in cell wall biosynthesis